MLKRLNPEAEYPDDQSACIAGFEIPENFVFNNRLI